MRYLGVDYGTKRVGLAISDKAGIIASPLTTLRVASPADAIAQVLVAVREYEIDAIVVGHALRMNGRRGTKAKECEAFAESIRDAGLTVELWDERLTSVQAERSLDEAKLSRRKSRQHVDHVAAQLILQTYLQAKSC